MTDDDDIIGNTVITMACDCKHTLADHAPSPLPIDHPCDLCDCPQHQAVDEDRECEMCGKAWHREPASDEDEFGLFCPGADGGFGLKDEYILALDIAQANKRKIEESPAAKRAYSERQRSPITIEELRADCNEVTAEVAPVIAARAALLDSDGAEIDVPHLTVRGQAPTPSPFATPDKNADDYSMYVGDDQ